MEVESTVRLGLQRDVLLAAWVCSYPSVIDDSRYTIITPKPLSKGTDSQSVPGIRVYCGCTLRFASGNPLQA